MSLITDEIYCFIGRGAAEEPIIRPIGIRNIEGEVGAMGAIREHGLYSLEILTIFRSCDGKCSDGERGKRKFKHLCRQRQSFCVLYAYLYQIGLTSMLFSGHYFYRHL